MALFIQKTSQLFLTFDMHAQDVDEHENGTDRLTNIKTDRQVYIYI